MRILLSFIIVLGFTNCHLIARKGYGAKKQKIENKSTITHWLTKNGLNSANLLSVAPENYYDFMPGLPQVPLLFDTRTGNFLAVGFTNGKYCPKGIDKSYSSLLPYSLLHQKPDSFLVSETIAFPAGTSLKEQKNYEARKDTLKFKLNDFVHKLRTPDGFSLSDICSVEDDYLLITPFALFLGDRVQVRDLNNIYHSSATNRFAKIKVVFLNLDKQQWWGDEWNKKINISF